MRVPTPNCNFWHPGTRLPGHSHSRDPENAYELRKSGLTPFNVFDAINPENWYYTK